MKQKLLLTLSALLSLNMIAQQLPVDASVRIGQLDNGLTYYISHSENPKHYADFQLVLPVGSILEEDHQNGIAHFVEHMAFKSIEHFPNGGMKQYLESLGLTFGEKLGAFTTRDSTWYFMSNVPTLREETVDSVLLVLYDWSTGLKFLKDEIDIERKVIIEEFNSSSSAVLHDQNNVIGQLHPGSRYAERTVIGDTNIIRNCEYDVIRDFYKKWYTPDHQAICIVGDVDVALVEEKIKALWGNVPKRTHKEDLPVFPITNDQGLRVVNFNSKVSKTELHFICEQLPPEYRGTSDAYFYDLMTKLICQMLNYRLQEMIENEGPNSSILGGVSSYMAYLGVLDRFTIEVYPNSSKEKQACKDLLIQLEKIRRYGFTNAEVEQAKKTLMDGQNLRSANTNAGILQQCRSHFLSKKPILSRESAYQMLEKLLPVISKDLLNQVAQGLMSESNLMIVYYTADETLSALSDEEAQEMLNEVKNIEIEAPKENTEIRTKLVEKAPEAGEIKNTAYNEDLGTTEWTLSNGVRVVLKPDTQGDDIQFYGSSLGGLSQVKTEDLYAANLTYLYFNYSGGVPGMSVTELQKIVGPTYCLPFINENNEGIQGSSTEDHIETLLQWNYLLFTTAPKRDENAFQKAIKSFERVDLQNPVVFSEDVITLAQNNNSPRTLCVSLLQNDIKSGKVTLDQMMKVYQERFANPADFVFCFMGNIDPNDKDFQKLVCTWLGSLKTTKHKEGVRDNKVRAPKGVCKKSCSNPYFSATANYIDYTSYDIPYSLENELCMEAIGMILKTRCMNAIRVGKGASYNVECMGTMTKLPKSLARLRVSFETASDKSEDLRKLVYQEIDTLMKNGPSPDDLNSIKKILIGKYDQNITGNGYMYILERYYLYGINYVEDYKTAVEKITEDKIRSVLKQLVSAGNNLEVVISPSTE